MYKVQRTGKSQYATDAHRELRNGTYKVKFFTLLPELTAYIDMIMESMLEEIKRTVESEAKNTPAE
jgi:hypothetical protein